VILALHTAEAEAEAVLDGGGDGEMGGVEDSAINVMAGMGRRTGTQKGNGSGVASGNGPGKDNGMK
jgi:hypothetical protein